MSTTTGKPLFIIVDDDGTNNSISHLTIANTIRDARVVSFTDPQTGLHFLTNDFAESDNDRCILLLNLNMPRMSGWEFLDRFARTDTRVRDRVKVYILTSSIDPLDRERSKDIEIVKGYLDKPLTPEIILGLRE